MSKIKPLPYTKLIKVFEKAGFVIERTTGDHVVMVKSGCQRPLVIPKWKEVPIFIIKNNLRAAGLTREDYFRLLNEL